MGFRFELGAIVGLIDKPEVADGKGIVTARAEYTYGEERYLVVFKDKGCKYLQWIKVSKLKEWVDE